jgi:hypothetical protein
MEVNAPQPSDPNVVAAAQTASNKETAIANANLNRFNQYAPQGAVEYSVVGTNEDGTPKYEQRTTYSPQEQAIYDINVATRQNVGNISRDQSARIGELLGTPVSLDNNAVEGRLFDLGRARLDPMFQQQNDALAQRLANQGIGINSEAYGRAMGLQGQKENDAYNQLLLTGRGQAVQEALTQRNQPINEITALMSGSQVSQPNFTAYQPVAQANTDVAGIYANYDAQRMQAAQMENAGNSAMLGGLFGLGAAGIRAYPWASDRRLKRDIVRTGNIGPKGLREVEWTYIWGGPRYRGYIAQEVAPLFPQAVHEVGGYLALDYSEIV